MAFPTTSQWIGKNVADMMNGTVTTIDLDLATAGTFKAALYTNSVATVDPNSALLYSGAPFNANEATSAGYTAGGAALVTPSLTTASGKTVWQNTGTTSWTGTTFSTAVFGAAVYHVATSRVLVASYFGNGSGFTTSSGTFTITWDATNGIGYFTF